LKCSLKEDWKASKLFAQKEVDLWPEKLRQNLGKERGAFG
jgi:hypothetical protein